ncbi:unnamed protein product [Leptidea sinapis]|uniref:Uncharacterized protein n=1 Tax=Leptidea sinapis TaxID=189913 RepID=A0A5E4R7Q4_9NEOP|nr:unnamed protein product [Leptidea sinapis]
MTQPHPLVYTTMLKVAYQTAWELYLGVPPSIRKFNCLVNVIQTISMMMTTLYTSQGLRDGDRTANWCTP